jgi:hypothetical protein
MKRLVSGMVLVLLVGLITSCASAPPPVDVALYRRIGQQNFSKFRFQISKDVVFTRVVSTTSTDARATVVRTDTQRNIINLKASTTGRVQGIPTEERLEIGFERLRDGSIPTLIFVQKRADGRYYFEQDSHGYVLYAGERYTVTYKGNDEPFLTYVSDEREKTNARNVGGLKKKKKIRGTAHNRTVTVRRQ